MEAEKSEKLLTAGGGRGASGGREDGRGTEAASKGRRGGHSGGAAAGREGSETGGIDVGAERSKKVDCSRGVAGAYGVRGGGRGADRGSAEEPGVEARGSEVVGRGGGPPETEAFKPAI